MMYCHWLCCSGSPGLAIEHLGCAEVLYLRCTWGVFALQVKQYEGQMQAQALSVAAMAAERDGCRASAMEATERATVSAFDR